MYHTTKKGQGPVAETAGIGICNATWRITGPDTNEGESTLAVYLAEQDADGDGFSMKVRSLLCVWDSLIHPSD